MKDNGTAELVVGSFNLRVPCDPQPNDWLTRAPRALRTIRQAQFHIFGVQETTPQQLKSIADGTDYSIIGHGRDADKTGESSSVIYDPQRLELLDQDTFWLSETPDVPASKSWKSTLPRIATVGVFKDKLTGRNLVFANTHLHHQHQYETQKNQLQVLLHRLRKHLQAQTPVILTGDFNAGPARPAPAYAATLFQDARIVSQVPAVGPEGPDGPTYHAYQKPENRTKDTPAPERIDYIFVSPGITVKAFQILDNFDEQGLASSDHYPLRAQLLLP